MPDDLKPMEAPITLEKNFLVAGKRITVQVVFPSSLGKQIGLENAYAAAQSALVRVESKHAAVKELRLGE
jgi:hypothetical protein